MKDKIKTILNNYSTFRAFLNNFHKIEYDFIREFFDEKYPMLKDKKYSIGMKIYWLMNDFTDFPLCPECGKPIKSNKCTINGYRITYCSAKCGHGSLAEQKRKEFNMKHYGCTNASQRLEVKEKREQTNLRVYGCKNPYQNKDVQKRAENKKLEKYGDPHYTNPEKRDKTNLEKFGCVNVFSNKGIQELIRKRNLEKYGCESPMQVPEIAKKAVMGNINTVSNKSYNTRLMTNQFSYPNFSIEYYIEHHQNHEHEYEFVCRKCGNIYMSRIHNLSMRKCPLCYSSITTSSKEQIIKDYIDTIYKGIVVRKNRTLLNGKELDIFLKDINLGIEFDGLYWHSELNGCKEYYHLSKTSQCENKGIRLIHIFEDEFDDKFDIVKTNLNYIINGSIGLDLSNVEIKGIDDGTSLEFHETYNLNGNIRSANNIGMYYNGELISVLSFSNKKNNDGYEITRYSVNGLYDRPIILNKFLDYIRDIMKITDIELILDRRWDNGKEFENDGFYISRIYEPDYWYLNNGCSIRYNKSFFRKENIQDKLKIYDPNKTLLENMESNKYTRIWDCGKLVLTRNLGK